MLNGLHQYELEQTFNLIQPINPFNIFTEIFYSNFGCNEPTSLYAHTFNKFSNTCTHSNSNSNFGIPNKITARIEISLLHTYFPQLKQKTIWIPIFLPEAKNLNAIQCINHHFMYVKCGILYCWTNTIICFPFLILT